MKNKEEATINKETNKSFKLPNKKVIIRYIPRNNPMVDSNIENHIAKGGALEGATFTYSAPLQKNGTIKNILTNEEKEHLEYITGMNLSVYGDFWTTFRVSIRKSKTGHELDLSNPIDYISYKLLKSLNTTEIAPSWADRNKILSYRFAITEEDEMTVTKKVDFNIKREAFKTYGRIENDANKLITVLKLLSNAPVSKNTSLLTLQDKVTEYVDNAPAKFLSVVNDEAFDTKMLILEGVDKGYIAKTGNRYTTTDGLELCESGEIPTLQNAVRYLDSPANQDVRSLIEAKINQK